MEQNRRQEMKLKEIQNMVGGTRSTTRSIIIGSVKYA